MCTQPPPFGALWCPLEASVHHSLSAPTNLCNLCTIWRNHVHHDLRTACGPRAPNSRQVGAKWCTIGHLPATFGPPLGHLWATAWTTRCTIWRPGARFGGGAKGILSAPHLPRSCAPNCRHVPPSGRHLCTKVRAPPSFHCRHPSLCTMKYGVPRPESFPAPFPPCTIILAAPTFLCTNHPLPRRDCGGKYLNRAPG